MEIDIIEQSEKILKVSVKGEDSTLCNVLAKELWNDKSVKVAGYRMEHALVDDPVIVIESSNPKKSLLEAISRLKKTSKELKTAFSSLK